MEHLTTFPVTTALIAANLIASVIAFNNRDFYGQNLFQVGAVLRDREYHRVITSGFLHVNALHLLLNMYVLYMFGRYLEAFYLGSTGYLLVYGAALIGASLWMLYDKRDTPSYSAVGASGAVSGILLAFCLFRPFDMLGLFFVIPMPAIVFAIGYIVLSAFLARRENAVIAHGAHLGGAIVGLVATLLVVPGSLGEFVAQMTAVLGGR